MSETEKEQHWRTTKVANFDTKLKALVIRLLHLPEASQPLLYRTAIQMNHVSPRMYDTA